MNILLNWLDDRLGYRQLVHEALYEPVPGGARWRYVWGSTLVFTFSVQVITGLFLWMAYSPSAQTAWESVYYIQHEMYMGGIVRGIHHFSAQLMIVLLAIHLIQVIIDGAYRAPREINFWLGLILMQIVLALSLTGYLLPWDQKGYYATQVSTKIVGATPVIGQSLQELAQGGTEYGHHTLTRFFAMHAGVLPGLLIFFLVVHIYVFRRHGITVPNPDRAPTTTFWPDQVLRDVVACLGVLAIVLLLAIFRGAELSGPANPSEAYSAARPEWYFLSIFQFLRFEAVERYGLAFGAIYVPGAIMLAIVLMPLVALIKGGHYFNVGFTSVLVIAIVGLTALAIYEDRSDPDHQSAVAEADRDAERIVELAQLPDKIPIEGAGALLRDDPLTQGPRIFSKYCSACHRLDGHDGRGRLMVEFDPHSKVERVVVPSAPDLANFGDRQWWRRVLTDYRNLMAPLANSDYDLELSESEGMIMWFDENVEALTAEANKADVDALIEYFVSHSGRKDLEIDEDKVERGLEILESGELTEGSVGACDDCHAEYGGEFVEATDNYGIPELNEYGSQAWLKAFLENPGSEQYFGDRNQMPSFADKLSPRELDLLVRWLTGDYAPTEVHPYPSLAEELQNRLAAPSSEDASEGDQPEAEDEPASDDTEAGDDTSV